MSRRTIIILIICTAILITASVTTIRQNPDIEDIFITSRTDLDEAQLQALSANRIFNDPGSDIYLIILVKHLTSNDQLQVRWYLKNDQQDKMIQEDLIHPDERGSGKILVSLARKNDRHSIGDYTVEVYLNQQKKISKSFSVIEN